jgi:hypothetical protein
MEERRNSKSEIRKSLRGVGVQSGRDGGTEGLNAETQREEKRKIGLESKNAGLKPRLYNGNGNSRGRS